MTPLKRTPTLLTWFSEYGCIMTGIGYLPEYAPGLAIREISPPTTERPESIFTIIHINSGHALFTIPVKYGFIEETEKIAEWLHELAQAAGFRWDISLDGIKGKGPEVLRNLEMAQQKFTPEGIGHVAVS